MMKKYLLLALMLFLLSSNTYCEEITVKSKNTLTVVEINAGDEVNYILRDGRKVQIELLETNTRIVLTTLDTLKKGSEGNATIFTMSCKLRIDGQEMELVRYVPVQQSFYEPYVVNGLQIWFDGLKSLSEFFNENHGDCLPKKEARFAFQDVDLPICPQQIGNWVSLPDKKLFAKNAYRGEDTWLGTYYGADLHGGLDLNMPSNTTLWAPIDFDEHYYFNSLKAGHNNNRWRGIRYWENGDTWHLQTHHLVQLLIPEYQPIKQGEPYAFSAGVHAGYTPHTHFVFRVKQPNFDWHYIDPWIIFWQIFENNKEKSKSINSHIMPLSPVETGEHVQFSSEGSRAGVWGNELEYYWDFGDGYTSIQGNPAHIFVEAGIFPVTLTIKDGNDEDSYTQHITVNGTRTQMNSFKISCNDCPSFRIRKNWKTREYGSTEKSVKTLVFKAYQNQKEVINSKELLITFSNFEWKEKQSDSFRFEIVYRHGKDWLDLKPMYDKDSIKLMVQPHLDKMINKYGFYEAYVIVNHDNVINSPQLVKVLVEFDSSKPESIVIIDDEDVACINSDYFWLAPEFHYDWSLGNEGKFFINKDNSNGEYFRYTPNLTSGLYQIELFGPAYQNKMLLSKTGGFYVKVKHKKGLAKVWVDPKKSLVIGKLKFATGRGGYVEIISDNSKGLIIADAVKFTKINQ